MKDKELKQLLKSIDEVNDRNVDIPDLSVKINEIAANAYLPQKNIKDNGRKSMETKQQFSRNKKKIFGFASLIACAMAIIFGAIYLPGLFAGNDKYDVAAVDKYQANSYNDNGDQNDRIKYSYTYENYDFYYIYLGEMTNVPLYYETALKFTGVALEYTFSTTDSTTDNITNTIAKSSSDTTSVVDANTKSTTTGGKVSAEASAKGAIFGIEVSVKAGAESSWSDYVSNTLTNTSQQTASLTDTVSNATSKTISTTKTFKYNLTKNDKVGYYRYTLFSASDVYLYVVKDSITGKLCYEFKECVIPDSYFWSFDYSETPSFRKSDDTGFELDLSILDNLPPTRITLKELTEHNDDHADYATLNDINTTTKKEVTVSVSNTSQNNNKTITIPNNVEVLTINGSGYTYSGVNFITATRTKPLKLNLKDFSFVAPVSTAAINCSSDLEINVTGTCFIIGGNGNNSYSSDTSKIKGGAGIYMYANALTINGTGSLKVSGGKGGNGLGTTTYAVLLGGGYYNYVTCCMQGGDGGNGIDCQKLTANIQALNINGGDGGNRSTAVQEIHGQSYGGVGLATCKSIINYNVLAIVIKGGTGEYGISSSIPSDCIISGYVSY